MTIPGAIIVYIIIWWCVFFAVLPRGEKHVWEEKDQHAKGSDLGAPVNPQLKKKFIRTSWITAVFWVIVMAVIMSGVLLRD